MATLPYVSPDLVKAYQSEISKSSSPATLKRKSISLNRFFDWAESQGKIPENPLQSQKSSNAFQVSKTKKNIGLKTYATIGITTGLVVLVFLLIQKLKLPIPTIPGFAQVINPESKIQTTNINSPTFPPGQGASESATFPANSAVIGSYNLFTKLQLSSTSGGPITSAQTVTFKVYKEPSDSTPLWTSDSQAVSPDSNGSALISLAGVPTELFFNNNVLYLDAEIGGSTSLSKRIPISTVSTPANLGGYLPANPETGATAETVPIISPDGSLLLASQSPAVKATAGNLLVEGQAVTVKAADGSGGNIEINPDANGYAHFLFEGNKGNFLNAQAPNLTTGSLYYGMVPNNATGYDLIKLQNGAPKMTTKFEVDASGNTKIAGDLYTGGTDRLTSAGALKNITGYSQNSGNFVINQNPGDFASITKKLTTGGALSDVLTLTLDERGKPATSNSDYSTLVLNRYDGNGAAMALLVKNGNAQFSGQLRLGNFTSLPSAIGAGSLVFNTSDSKVYVWDGSAWVAVGSGGSSAFDAITSGTNTSAAMVVGSGASLSFSGTGTITASSLSCTDCLDFTEFKDAMTLDAATNIATAGLTLSTSGTGALNFASTGQVTFAGNVDATNGLDVTTANLTVGGANFSVDQSNGNVTMAGDVAVNGGDITTTQTTFNLINTTATTLNIGGAATAIELGTTTGTTSVNNNLTVDGNTTLGNATSDTITFTGRVNSNIIPSADITYDLGSTLLKWNNVYAFAFTQNGNAVCDVSGAGCPASSGTNFWQLNSLVLSPVITSYDVAVGGTGTSSAKFQAFGLEKAADATSRIAKINSTLITTGTLFEATSSAITSGNIIKLGTGGDAATFSGNGLYMDFDNLGGGNFTGNFLKFDNATTTKFTVDASGNLNTAGTISTAGTQRLDASGNLTNIGTTQLNGVTYTWPASATANYVLQADSTGTSTTLSWVAQTSGGSNLWQLNTQVVSPANTTWDVAVGGTGTSSAKFQAFALEKPAGDVVKITSSGITTGNVLEATASAITGGNILKLAEGGDQSFIGNVILADIDQTGGGNGAFTGNFFQFLNAGAEMAHLDYAGNLALAGNAAVNGGSVTTTATIANLFNTIANTLNIGGAAGTINIGPTGVTGTSILFAGGSADTGCTISDATGNLACSGDVAVNGGDVTTTQTTATLFNATATTLSIGGAATTFNIGPTGNGASSIVLSGGSGDTGCTLNGATGDWTCAGFGAFGGVGQFGGTAATTFSRFGTTTSSHSLSSPNDVLVQGNLELDNVLYLDGRTISNPSGTVAVLLPVDPTTTTAYLSASRWTVDNTATTTGAALSVTQEQSGDIFYGSGGLGSELITSANDRNFGGAGNWTGTNWSIVSAAFKHATGNTADATLTNANLTSGAIDSGGVYRLVFTVTGRTAGTLTPKLGTATGTAVSTNATFTQDITANAETPNLLFTPSSDFDGSIDDISLKRLLDFRIANDGSITLTTGLASTTNTQEGTIFYDNDSAGSSSTDHLYLRGSDAAWHRIALDMTQYSVTNASVTNQSYVEIAHNQNTNDLSTSGWFFDTVDSLWKKVTDWSNNIINNLDNQFNPSFSQKKKATTVALNSTNIYGNGADGALTVSGSTNLNTGGAHASSCADGGDEVNYSVTALTSTTASLSTTPSSGCLSTGDEVLLINLEGVDTPAVKVANVGNWETLRISTVSGNSVTFTTSKNRYYGDDSGTDTNIGTTQGTNQLVMLQRVPNYTNVTVNTAASLNVNVFNGTKNGVLFFRANGTVTNDGSINANISGYRGGSTIRAGGESICGAGGTTGGNGAAGGGGAAGAVGKVGFCGGGGGGGATTGGSVGGAGSSGFGGSGGGGGAGNSAAGVGGGGAGGGYGNGGLKGTGGTGPADGGTNSSGNGGNSTTATGGGGGGGGGSYGSADLSTLMFGSGAGAAGGNGATAGGTGGTGGGVVYIAAATINVTGNGAVQSIGGNGGNGTANTSSGGGAAGGSIYITGQTLILGTTQVKATGGTAGTVGSAGGAGGVGRIAIAFSNSISGTTSPTYTQVNQSGYYGVWISKEINIPGATSISTFSRDQTLNTFGQVEVLTRTGNSADSTDRSWEAWKPTTATTNIKSLDDGNSTTGWSTTNGLTVNDGQLARDVHYFEDDDIDNSANKSLKFGSVGSQNGYSEKTITSNCPGAVPCDLTNFNLISAWVYATSSGEIQLGFGETNSNDNVETIQINTVNTWRKVYWDISDVANANKDAITKLRVTVLSPNQTVYVDNIQGEDLLTSSPATVTSTANNYIQYMLILTTTDGGSVPSTTNFQLTYSDGTSHTIDASSIRLTNAIANVGGANSYFTSSHLTVTETTFDSTKSLNVNKGLTSVTQAGGFDPGTGADGAITVSSSTNINTTTLISGRSASCGDAPNYSVTALTSTTATVTPAPDTVNGCLVTGDEVLLINLQGTNTLYGNVGNWETLRVSSISGSTITFSTAKSKFYGNGTNSDDTNIGTTQGTNQLVMLQRVPNYTNVTVNSSINFTPSAFSSPRGGVMFFRATGTVTVGSSGTINTNASGYGGAGAQNSGGDSFCGIGGTVGAIGAGGGGGATNAAGGNGVCGGGGGGGNGSKPGGNGSINLGGAGGGGGSSTAAAGAGGGGAGYGTAGKGGQGATGAAAGNGVDGGTNNSGNGGNGTSANSAGGGGGGTYGSSTLTTLMFGSGGGASGQNSGLTGGTGGGIVYISGNTITVSGGIQSKGGNGSAAGTGGGGGAGGSIRLEGATLTLGTSLVTAAGGSGGVGTNTSGGDGGSGIVVTNYSTSISGSATPTASSTNATVGDYSMFISDEIHTPDATSYQRIKRLQDLQTYGLIQFQTRSGKSPNSTDGTWEAWKPASSSSADNSTTGVGCASPNCLSLQTANNATEWTTSNVTLNDGQLARNVDFFEDEDLSSAADKNIKLGSVGASNGYAESTPSANLSNYDYISAWVYATASGNLVKIGFGESAATEQEKTFTINSSNTWQRVYWDIHGIDPLVRDAVTKLRVSVLATNTTVYVDNITANRFLNTIDGSTITSTPNEYIQYRAILSTSNSGYHPVLYNVQIIWNNGFKIVQTDANTVRMYNYTGSTQQIRLDAIVFGADLAEWYTVDDPEIKAGDVVALTGKLDDNGVPILRKASGVNDPGLIGGISTKAGQTLGLQADNRRLLALAGRIPVNIDPASPAIKAGDALTSGSTPGTAQKAGFGQMVFARATADWSPDSGGDQILAIVNNTTYSQGGSQIVDAALMWVNGAWQAYDNSKQEVIDKKDAFSELIAANIQAGAIQTKDLIADNITTKVLKTQIITPLPDSTDIAVKLGSDATPSGKLSIQNSLGEEVSSLDSYGNATFSGTVNAGELHAGKIYADEIVGGSFQSTDSAELKKIKDLLTQVESDQNLLSQAANWKDQLATDSASLDHLAVSDLFVTNQAAFSSLSVTNSITVGTDLVFSSSPDSRFQIPDSSINTLSAPLKIQSLAMAPVEIMNGLFVIDTNGNVKIAGDLAVAGKITAPAAAIKDLSIDNLTIASSPDATPSGVVAGGDITTNATAGQGVIPAGVSQITITNPKVTDYTLVYVTPTSTTDNYVLYIKSKQNGQFVVGFDQALPMDVNFNWWIVQIQQ